MALEIINSQHRAAFPCPAGSNVRCPEALERAPYSYGHKYYRHGPDERVQNSILNVLSIEGDDVEL